MLRERRDEDDGGIARVIRESTSGWVSTEAGVAHRRRTSLERARHREWVEEDEGEIVGWSRASLKTDGERSDVAWMSVFVRPAWRGRGLGGKLYEPIAEHVRELGARRLLADGAAEPATAAFAEGRGFRHTLTSRLSTLDPQDHDGTELAALSAAKEAEGFTLAAFSEFASSPQLIHAVDAEASLDEPADEPITDWPFDEWLRSNWEQPDLSHDGSFCVVHGGRPVAIAEVRVDPEEGVAAYGFTATLRDFRGLGLARLAKLASIDWLRERGIRELVTQNDETNAAMLAVNARLGYRPGTSWRSYVKDVDLPA